MRAGAGDPVCGRGAVRQRCLGKPTAVAVFLGETEGKTLVAVDHGEPLSKPQLAIPRADTAFDDMDNIADAGVANLFRAQLERLVEMSQLMAKGA